MVYSSQKQNIVVVGGGGAGASIAKELAQKISDYNILLITARDVYVHPVAAIRMLTTSEGALENSAVIPYDTLFAKGSGSVKVGKVVAVEHTPGDSGGNVLLEAGDKISFRFLVLATGSTFPGPLAALDEQKQELIAEVHDWREKLQKAKSVVIIGAGAVGLEFAGEIRDIYPKKGITIVHDGRLPLNDAYPESFRKDILRRWKLRDVSFVLEDRIDDVPEEVISSVTTKNGKKIDADVVIFAGGPKPNTGFLESLGILDERGFVKVLPTFQVSGHPSIFAAGDIVALKEQKQLAKIPGHTSVIVANMVELAQSKQLKKNYKGTFEAIFVTNGKTHGAGYVDALWGLKFGDRLVPMLKGKDLFVTQTRATFGL